MKSMNFKGLPGLFLVACLAACTAWAKPSDSSAVSDPATEWQEAAFNYEYAAEAQETVASETLEQARYLRDIASDDSAIVRHGKVQAGNLELRAADLLIAASGNLDNAARVWAKAVSAAGSNTSSGKYFASAAREATERASSLLRQAVDLCEQAAVGFSVTNERISQAGANQKAAGIRERLATRP